MVAIRLFASLFALFAAGRTPREAMYGRQAAERYLAGRLSYEYTQAYLKQYDAEIARMNKRMPHSDDERLLAKRRSKLSVRLLVLCQQIIAELDAKDRLIVFARLAEMAVATAAGTRDPAAIRTAMGQACACDAS